MTATTASLRERQAEQVRTAILDATIGLLEDSTIDDLVMNDVAQASGVSLRTLYRYFPDRAALLHAAGEHLYADLGVPYTVDDPREIAASFLDAAQRLATRPALTRALVQTTAGRTARSLTRERRSASIRAALAPLTAHADADTARWATAVITHLCSAVSWISITDDSDLDEVDAQRAVAWAIDTLVRTLEEQR